MPVDGASKTPWSNSCAYKSCLRMTKMSEFGLTYKRKKHDLRATCFTFLALNLHAIAPFEYSQAKLSDFNSVQT